MLTCLIGKNIINCFDGTYSKEHLKRWSDKNVLKCPVCHKAYEYCHGNYVQPYFRHKDKGKCEDIYSEPETAEHAQGKRDLYKWVKSQNGVTNAVLEAWLPETKQRPDIMFEYKDKKYVIEYQCTPISTEYDERHMLYQAAGIYDIWILGTNNYFEYNMKKKAIEKYNIGYYHVNTNIFLFNVENDVYGKHLNSYIDELFCQTTIDIRKLNFRQNICDGRITGISGKYGVDLFGMIFSDGRFYIPELNDPETKFIELRQKKIQRQSYRQPNHFNIFRLKKLSEYIESRLYQYNKFWSWNIDYSGQCITANLHIFRTLYGDIDSSHYGLYGKMFSGFKDSMYGQFSIDNSIYKNVEMFIKRVCNDIEVVQAKIDKIHKTINYFTQKKGFCLILLSSQIVYFEDVPMKYVHLCKDAISCPEYCTELYFLEELTKYLNCFGSKKNQLYVRLPRSFNLSTGGIMNCSTNEVDILFYFQRLGFHNIKIWEGLNG